MKNLKDNILKKYQRATKKFIKHELLTKGYIRTPENEILKLNVFNNWFDVVDIESIIKIINNYVPNFWNITPETQKEIINNNLIELLPVATKTETTNYINYYSINEKVINEKELKNDVKELIKENEKKHKSIFKGGYQAPEYQAQALINRNVFYCKKTQKYYKYNDNENKFISLTPNEILNYIKSDFNNLNVTKYDIMDYMKTSYLFFVLNTDLPIIYNNNRTSFKLLESYKNSFEKINKIVATFE